MTESRIICTAGSVQKQQATLCRSTFGLATKWIIWSGHNGTAILIKFLRFLPWRDLRAKCPHSKQREHISVWAAGQGTEGMDSVVPLNAASGPLSHSSSVERFSALPFLLWEPLILPSGLQELECHSPGEAAVLNTSLFLQAPWADWLGAQVWGSLWSVLSTSDSSVGSD